MPNATATPSAIEENNTPVHFVVLQQAAEWFSILRSDTVSRAEQQRFLAWLNNNPANRLAWQRVEAINRRFEILPKRPAHAALNTVGTRRRQAIKTLAAFAVGMPALWIAGRYSPIQQRLADYHTGVGETREIPLPEGTRVWLNTASAINVTYDDSVRHVQLVAGEMLVDTAPDNRAAKRPFTVSTEHGQLRALGTRFSVRHEGAACRVSVFEGAVEVQSATKVQSTLRVESGQHVVFTLATMESPSPVQNGRQTWTQGVLLADNIRLGDFVAEVSRYRHGYLGCAPEVENLPLIGAFPAADTDRILATLEKTLPVRIRTIMPGWTAIEARAQ